MSLHSVSGDEYARLRRELLATKQELQNANGLLNNLIYERSQLLEWAREQGHVPSGEVGPLNVIKVLFLHK